MSITMQELAKFTEQLGLEFKQVTFNSGEYLVISVPTKTPDGERELSLLVRSYDEGTMFEAVMAGFLRIEMYRNSKYKELFLFYLLHSAWNTKFGTPEVDKDGEVRWLVEIPLEDAPMTIKQFARVIHSCTTSAMQLAVGGAKVLTNGELPDENSDSNSPVAQIEGFLRSMRSMVATTEGREMLIRISEDENAPEQIRESAKNLLQQIKASEASIPDQL